MKLCTNLGMFISRIDGTRDDQTSAFFRDSFWELNKRIAVQTDYNVISVSLAKSLTETLNVSIRQLRTQEYVPNFKFSVFSSSDGLVELFSLIFISSVFFIEIYSNSIQ